MEEDLWEELQYLELGRDDPEILIPHTAYAGVLARNRLSLIGRPLNPSDQNIELMIYALPRCWGLTSRVHGRVIDDGYVQFLFQSEVDLVSVQRREPWLFNNWFVALQRWQDFPQFDFLSTIDLWVQIRGIPLPFVSEDTTRLIASTLGGVIELDFQAATTHQIAFIRVRVRIGITDSLRFFRRVCFQSGETAMIGFEYERLRNICIRCCRLTHRTSRCPFPPMPPLHLDNHDGSEAPEVPNDEHDGSLVDNNSPYQAPLQDSDHSYPAPISQPPRPITPPVNQAELAGANPLQHLPSMFMESIHHFERPVKQESTGSNNPEICSKDETKYERGECSKRKGPREACSEPRRNQRHKQHVDDLDGY